MNDDSLISDFRVKVLKADILPGLKKEIDDIIDNKKWWKNFQNRIEHFYEIILLGSFVSIFFKSQLITGIFIGLVGALNRTIGNSIIKQKLLSEELNFKIKQIGLDKIIPIGVEEKIDDSDV